MEIEFADKSYLLPDPEPPYPSVLIEVKEAVAFRKPVQSEAHRFDYPHRLSKIIFFLLHEGPRLASSKARAAGFQRRLHAKRALVLAYGKIREGSDLFVGLGPQEYPYSSVLAFPRRWCVKIPDREQWRPVLHRVLRYLSEHPERFEAMHGWSPYSGTHVEFDLEIVLRDIDSYGAGDGGNDAMIERRYKPSPRKSRFQRKEPTMGNERALFLIGAGAYAQAYVLPSLRPLRRHTVVDLNPAAAAVVGAREGFGYWDTSATRALTRLRHLDEPCVVICTYHSTHLELAERALAINERSRIFMEKPPVTDFRQLCRLFELRRQEGAFIEIGFNRRHSRIIERCRDLLSLRSGPITVTYIVKELGLPACHWYYWPTQGTRITGNLCHWIDLSYYLIGAPPVGITLASPSGIPAGDEVSMVIAFRDGSKATLVSTDRGNALRGVQEYIEIRRGDLTLTIHDFLKLEVQDGARHRVFRYWFRNKGHAEMYRHYLKAVENRMPPSYPAEDLLQVCRMYLAASEMARRGMSTLSLTEPEAYRLTASAGLRTSDISGTGFGRVG
jgi:predicted dehydrogenase